MSEGYKERVQTRFSVPIPWAEGVQPTAHQVVDWLLQLPHAEQVEWVAITQECLWLGNTCLTRNHEHYIDHLEAERTRLLKENAELRYEAHQLLGVYLAPKEAGE